MNTVVHALWSGDDSGPLIMPGSIPLSVGDVNTELSQYLPDSWKVVIDTDVDGDSSEPARIDAAKPLFGQRRTTRRLARTVFFGAAPTRNTAQKGLETQRVFLGTAIPGDQPGNFHSALTSLADRATYFDSGQGKYWYDLQANITKRAKDQAERLHDEDVWAEILRRLAGQDGRPGGFARVHVAPEDHADIPDVPEARLVVVHPRYRHRRRALEGSSASSAATFARDAIERRGTGHRTYRNALVLLAADNTRMGEVESAVRDYLGWAYVADNAAELDLTHQQVSRPGPAGTPRTRQSPHASSVPTSGCCNPPRVTLAPLSASPRPGSSPVTRPSRPG